MSRLTLNTYCGVDDSDDEGDDFGFSLGGDDDTNEEEDDFNELMRQRPRQALFHCPLLTHCLQMKFQAYTKTSVSDTHMP